MTRNPYSKEEERLDTFELAEALFEDISHMRKMLTLPRPPNGFIRQISAPLRRLLVSDRDLKRVADCRVGRIKLEVPNVDAVKNHPDVQKLSVFALGGVDLFGAHFSDSCVCKGNQPILFRDPSDLTALNLERFLAQDCLFADGEWFSRGSMITYVANAGSGIHSPGREMRADHARIHDLRYVHTSCCDKNLQMPAVNMCIDGTNCRPNSDLSRNGLVTAPLFQTLAAAYHLVNSPDIVRLVEAIGVELDEHYS